MDYARQLQPTFLIVHQFNEFVQPDEGWNANTDDDIEPADLWGFGALHAVAQQVRLYRESIDDTTATALRWLDFISLKRSLKRSSQRSFPQASSAAGWNSANLVALCYHLFVSVSSNNRNTVPLSEAVR
jgi:hypothetical protein